MVIGLYLHSKTNRHSAEAAPHWLHPLTCDHGVGGRMQHSTCTWVCYGACWPVFGLISWRTLPLCYQTADFVDWNSRQTAIHFSTSFLHSFSFTHTLFFSGHVHCFEALNDRTEHLRHYVISNGSILWICLFSHHFLTCMLKLYHYVKELTFVAW